MENNHSQEVFPWEWDFWAPHQATQPGGLALEGGAPRALRVKANRACVQELYRAGKVYLWWIHFDIWQNEYNYVKFKNKI